MWTRERRRHLKKVNVNQRQSLILLWQIGRRQYCVGIRNMGSTLRLLEFESSLCCLSLLQRISQSETQAL